MSVKLCECGCGLPAPIATYTDKRYGWIKGQPKRFIHNHHHRGHRNVNYNMGLTFDKSQNRWFIRCRDGSYVAYARAVMECHLKRHLKKHEVVHHINGDPSDDRLENLQLMTNQRIHRKHHIKYSNDCLLQKLRDLAIKLGRIPTSSDVDRDPNTPPRETYRARFGGLIKARMLAGLNNGTSEVTRL